MNPDAYVTRAQASLITGVQPDTIGKWHARGWTNPEGARCRLRTRPGAGRSLLFRLGDILAAERDTRRNPRARRRVSRPVLAA